MSPLAQKYLEDEPVEGLAERLETRRVVLQLGGANLGDVACAGFSRWAGGPTAEQLWKALRERWRRLRRWSVRASQCRTCRWPALRWRRRW